MAKSLSNKSWKEDTLLYMIFSVISEILGSDRHTKLLDESLNSSRSVVYNSTCDTLTKEFYE